MDLIEQYQDVLQSVLLHVLYGSTKYLLAYLDYWFLLVLVIIEGLIMLPVLTVPPLLIIAIFLALTLYKNDILGPLLQVLVWIYSKFVSMTQCIWSQILIISESAKGALESYAG